MNIPLSHQDLQIYYEGDSVDLSEVQQQRPYYGMETEEEGAYAEEEGAQEEPAPQEEKEEEGEWLPDILQTATERTRAAPDRMGVAVGPMDCFGCAYQSMGPAKLVPHVKMSDAQLANLSAMVGSLISNGAPLDSAAIEVALYYEQLREKCNATARSGERLLPEWNAATIVAHVTRHLKDADMWTDTKLEETTLISEKLAREMFSTHSITGASRCNYKAVELYMKLTALQKTLLQSSKEKSSIISAATMAAPLKTAGRSIYATGKRRPKNNY